MLGRDNNEYYRKWNRIEMYSKDDAEKNSIKKEPYSQNSAMQTEAYAVSITEPSSSSPQNAFTKSTVAHA